MKTNPMNLPPMDKLDPVIALNMPETSDMTLAMDLLMRAKEGVRNTATALTESVFPEARVLLRGQLHQAIQLHQEITELMVRKKWFHPHDLREQYQLDQLSAHKTVQIAQMKLYPDDTRRMGMFERTPDEHMEGSRA